MLKEKIDGMSIISIAALHDVVEDAGGDLLASFKDIRLVRVAPCVVAVIVMLTESPAVVSSNFNTWTVRAVKVMGTVTAMTYITPSFHLFANDKQRNQHRWEISST